MAAAMQSRDRIVFSNAQEMQVGAIVEDRPARGNADGAPRLRISLNNPLADLSRSGGKPPSVKVTTGAAANCWVKPRNACGKSSSLQRQS
jgi:hypothetical protein